MSSLLSEKSQHDISIGTKNKRIELCRPPFKYVLPEDGSVYL